MRATSSRLTIYYVVGLRLDGFRGDFLTNINFLEG
jgi:hypothetical protein